MTGGEPAAMYDDHYATCAETHATLCIYPGEIDPDEVTRRLEIEPTTQQKMGEPVRRAGRPPKVATLSGWFLRTRGQVESKDVRRHLDWLLDRLTPRIAEVWALRSAGCRIEIACYWLGKTGQGGPTLSPAQMEKLAALNIELWFDLYGPTEEPIILDER